MAHDSARPLRALDRTRLLDGTLLGVPASVESNPLLEEIGFERVATFSDDEPAPDVGNPNATVTGAEEAGAHIERTPTEPAGLRLPRVVANALTALLENDRRRHPEDGDAAFLDANRALNVAPGTEETVLDVKVEAADELFVTSIGTDAADGQDQVEIVVDGDVEHRSLFSPMTLSEARTGRCFNPPLRARKSVQVKIKNNGVAAAGFTANLRGWRRPLVGGTLGKDSTRD